MNTLVHHDAPLAIVDARGLIRLQDGSMVDVRDLDPEDIDAIERSLSESERVRSAQEYRDSLREHVERIMTRA